MAKYNIYIICGSEEDFLKKSKDISNKYPSKICHIQWIPAEYLKLTQCNKKVLKDLNTRWNTAGKKIFYEVGCNSCHIEKHVTRSDGPFENLNNQVIYPYSDFLLHDMGDGLSDRVPEFLAEGNEWRTPPLWGIGLTKIVSGRESYLHDGRAETLEEAILWHGGESLESTNKFKDLDINQRNQLLKFISSL